jgi:hypothetical protein
MKARRVLRESNEALKEAFGPENQRGCCQKFEEKHGLQVAKEHLSVESSSTWKRDELDDIIAEAIREKDDIPCIEFPRVNRFARNLEAACYYFGLLRKNELVVAFAFEEYIIDGHTSPMKALQLLIDAYQADQDGRIMKHSMHGGQDKLAEIAHEVPAGMVIWPFDYMPKRIYGKMVTGKPSKNAERAAWVVKWVEWVLDEGASISNVCWRMNQAHVPTPRQTRHWKGAAKEWHRSNITDILRSRQLRGEFSWKGKVYLKEESLRIISDERFEALQKRLAEIRANKYYNAAKYDYPPLRKMVYCSCGHLMYGIPASGVTYYRCPKCKRQWINAQRLWSSIQSKIREDLLREERLIPAIRTQFDSSRTIERLEQDIKAKDREIHKWKDAKDRAFEMGMHIRNYPQDKVQEQIDQAEGKIQAFQTEKVELERRLATVRQRILNEEGIRRFCRLAAKNLDNLTKDQWQMLLAFLRLHVIVHGKELVTVKVGLPPVVRDSAEIELSRL